MLKKMKKVILVLFSVTLLSSCSMLSALSPTPTLGVEATLGNKEEAIVGQVGSKQEITVESLSGGLTTQNIQEVPMEFMLLMVLGWLLPSPLEMWKGLINILSSFGSFILKLFNKT